MRKTVLLIVTLAFTGVIWAQSKTTSAFTLNHLALSVKNVDTSAKFYEEVFGLQEITNRTEIEGIRWFSLGGEKELHLISILKKNVRTNKAVHFALTSANFDAFVTTLSTMNINFSNWPGTAGKINIRADGIKQIFLQDPDGYWIEVNSVGQDKE